MALESLTVGTLRTTGQQLELPRTVLLVALAVLATNLGTFAAAATGSAASPRQSRYPPEVRTASNAWPLPNHDYLNSRDAGASPINAVTIQRLRPTWAVNLAGGASTSPIVVGATTYVQDTIGEVLAIDSRSGETRWRSPALGYDIGPYGVSVGWGKVFATTPTGVVAYKSSDGQKLWTATLAQPGQGGVDIQTLPYGGKVFAATVPVAVGSIYPGGASGSLEAIDADTGRVDWRFDTVHSPTLWGNPDLNSGGGAWYPPAIDTARGIVYWGTANPAPFVGNARYPNGSSRPGANLYTDSAVALSAKTGKLLWYHQAYAHDLFDRDQVQTMIVNERARGRPRQVVISTGKGGYVLGLDPSSGRRLWKTAVGVHQNDGLTALSGPTTVLPGTYGGVLTPPASANGNVYVATLNASSTLYPDKTAYFGGMLGTMPGEVVALNARTGAVRWDTKVPGDPTGGVTIVNNVALTATYQGQIVALNRSTGNVVWVYTAPGEINGWMSIAGNEILVPVTSPPEIIALALPSGTA